MKAFPVLRSIGCKPMPNKHFTRSNGGHSTNTQSSPNGSRSITISGSNMGTESEPAASNESGACVVSSSPNKTVLTTSVGSNQMQQRLSRMLVEIFKKLAFNLHLLKGQLVHIHQVQTLLNKNQYPLLRAVLYRLLRSETS